MSFRENSKAFTLIELLVVVAIIGILAAVGVVAYNGYTGAAKVSTTKTNYKLIIKEILLISQKCEVEGTVDLKPDYNSDKIYNLNCPFHSAIFAHHIENEYKIRNPYMPTERMTQPEACNQSEIDGLIGYVYIGRYGNGINVCSCFKKPCNSTNNRLEKFIAFY